jgi:type I restriction enzyme S subunit
MTCERPDGWLAMTLGAACVSGDGVQTGPFGSQLHASDYVDDGIPSIMPVNIADGRVAESGIARITEADAQRLSRYLVQPGDIIYSRRGDVTRCALITEHEAGWLCGTGCLRVRPAQAQVEPRFLLAHLSSPPTRAWIKGMAVGTSMPNLNTKILSDVPLVLPSLDEQRRIAAVLGALDDAADDARRTADRARVIASRLFERQFGPNWPAARYAGREPNGGAWGRVGDLATFVYGKALAAAVRQPGDVRVVGSSGVVGRHDESLFDGPAIVVGRKGTAGSVIWMDHSIWPIDTTFVALPNPATSLEYLYHALRAADLPSLTADSAVPGLNRDAALAQTAVIPSPGDMARFSATAGPLHRLAATKAAEAERLRAIRDELLPKLVSGKLRVAEGFAPGAAAAAVG